MTETMIRTASLREYFRAVRTELQHEVRIRVRAGRAERRAEGRDDLEESEADTQGDISRALLQMTAETLTQIDAALLRLDAGMYGFCVECETQMSEKRLRALPSAVRCQKCEERREWEDDYAVVAERHGGLSPFAAMARA